MSDKARMLDALKRASADNNTAAVSALVAQLKEFDANAEAQRKADEEATAPQPSTLDSIGGFLKENMDLPAGLVGGIGTGIATGMVAGPIGGIVGGIVGGAVGSGAGSLLSDYLMDEELDYTDAGEKALFSAGMDVATLGTFKAAKVGLKAVGFGKAELAELATRAYSPVKEAFTAGTQASLKATQELLESGGGSLSAFQTGAASGFRKVSESIGDLGILSRSIGEARRAANSDVIRTNVQGLIDGKLGDLGANASSANIGSEIYGLIDGARKAAIKGYGAELAVIKESVGSYPVSTTPYTRAFSRLLKENTIASKTEVIDGLKVTTPLSYSLDKSAVALTKEYDTIFSEAKSLSPKALFDFEKKITAEIDSAGVFGSGLSTKAQKDLIEVRSVFRETTEQILTGVNPEALAKYQALNKVYGEAMEGMLPEINRTAIASGKDGYFEALGSIVVGQGSTTKVQAMMNSIDKSFAVLAKEGTTNTGSVASAAEAKNLIRQGYLKGIFGELEGEFNPKKYAAHALRLEKPTEATRAKAIMGDSFPEYKQLMNAMLEATKEPKGFFGSLVLRSREASSVGSIVSSIGTQSAGATAAGFMGGPLAAVAVLGLPAFMAKVATDKTAVRKLLLMDSQAKKLSGEALSAFIASGLGKIIEGLPEETKAALRHGARTQSKSGPPQQQQQPQL
jgi:hypothetical protein